ncbi:hypothetical protein ACFLQ6_07970 [Thermoproteota archaeon]
MRYLILPVLLTVLCLTGFTSQVQAQAPALMSLEHGGTTDVMGSRIFDVVVCNEFEVELWVRDLPLDMLSLIVYVTWDPELMELQNVELNLPAPWWVEGGPAEEADSFYIKVEGDFFSLNWKWMVFTFHCKGEGSSPINIPEIYEQPTGGSLRVGPDAVTEIIERTLLKAAVTQTPEPPPVGGLVTPTNKLAILTPYIALAGLIIAVSTVYVIKRRKD